MARHCVGGLLPFRFRLVFSLVLFFEAALLAYYVLLRFPLEFYLVFAVSIVGAFALRYGLVLSRRDSDDQPRVRVNVVVKGEPARWLREWKRRGLFTSTSDAVVQALRALNEKITELDIKMLQLKNFRRLEEGEE